MSVIVHLLSLDKKFTAGYIEAMKIYFPEHEHHFFVHSFDSQRLTLFNDENVYYYSRSKQILFNRRYINLLKKCDKIIVSWVSILHNIKLFLIFSGLVSKTYLQFWGGDFYSFRGKKYSIHHIKESFHLFIHHLFIKTCAGTINLIHGDIEKLCAVFPNKTKHFVAPMMGSPLRRMDFKPLREKHKTDDTIRIFAGNSATVENQHMITFHALEHLKNENIEIICPLSYGDSEYRDKIIAEGKRIFGDKFKPITEFMSFDKYVEFLSSGDIGVFNNNRQQGMGNISLLIRLGKKVYIREDTAMWEHFRHTMHYSVYPASELDNVTFNELINFPAEQAYNNIKNADECLLKNEAVEQWRKVFAD